MCWKSIHGTNIISEVLLSYISLFLLVNQDKNVSPCGGDTEGEEVFLHGRGKGST